jgi:hypothetical protein
MNYNIALSSKAEAHIQTGYDWHEQQRKGLGEDFLTAIDKALQSIQSNPMFYSFRKKNIRGYAISCIRFPYPEA